MTTPTLREALETAVARINAILIHDDWDAFSAARKEIPNFKAALAAQPELPEPLCAFRRKNQINQEWETCSKKQWAIFSQKPAHYELALFYTADQLQQAVEQARASAPQGVPEAVIRETCKNYQGTAWGMIAECICEEIILAAAPQPVAQKDQA